MTQPELDIVLSLEGFSQTLAIADSITNWSFPVLYTPAVSSDPAEVAQIKLTPPTTLTPGPPNQTITGTGTNVGLFVELGTATAVKVMSNPNNLTDCTWPMVSSVSSDDSFDLFQIACASQTTNWTIVVYFSIHHHPESPPTSAEVSLLVDGTATAVPEGESKTYTPSGMTLAFQVSKLTGPGSIKIAYTLTAASAAA